MNSKLTIFIYLQTICLYVSQVNRSVSDQHAGQLERLATWHALHTSLGNFTQWLTEAQHRLAQAKDETSAQAKLTQKELEKQVTLRHRYAHLQGLVNFPVFFFFNC